jgi:hypothetical protein
VGVVVDKIINPKTNKKNKKKKKKTHKPPPPFVYPHQRLGAQNIPRVGVGLGFVCFWLLVTPPPKYYYITNPPHNENDRRLSWNICTEALGAAFKEYESNFILVE